MLYVIAKNIFYLNKWLQKKGYNYLIYSFTFYSRIKWTQNLSQNSGSKLRDFQILLSKHQK